MSFLDLQLGLLIITAQLSIFETLFQRILGTGLALALVGFFFFLLINELVVDAIVKISIIVLLILSIQVFAFRSKPNHFLRVNLFPDFIRPLKVIIIFIKAT
jgi:hypothetical protein